MKKLLIFTFLAIASMANAQYNPEVIGPLYTGSNFYRGVNDLTYSATLNNQLFFSMRKDDNTTDILATDGTIENTLVLKNISFLQNVIFKAFDNHIYFSVRDLNDGLQLWKTDGTVAGTVFVAAFGGQAYVLSYTVIDNKLFFASDNGVTLSDDTQPYVLIAGSNTPLLLNSNLYEAKDYTEYNGKLYFTANDMDNQNSNRELYTSDGTVAGTVMVKDIRPGAMGSNPNGLIKFQDKLFFGADDGISGNEIWSTDGTSNGTQLFKDIIPGIGAGIANFLSGIHNGKLYFATNATELWATDGTPAGTNFIKHINLGGFYQLSGFVSVNNKLLMAADDGVHGTEIWVSDGTTANTNLLLDIRQGAAFGVYNLYQSNVFCGNQLFFAGADQYGLNPWVTDGTVAGTHIVENLIVDSGEESFGGVDRSCILLNNKIYFVGKNTIGNQLYSMDFTCTLGINQEEKMAFKVYPNPVTNVVNIQTATEFDNVSFYNSLGESVMEVEGNNTQIDISSLSSGLYFMKITHKGQASSTQKILKL